MHYDPPGIEIYDFVRQRRMKLVTAGPFDGWMVYEHPDGQWVTLRRATEEDRERSGGFPAGALTLAEIEELCDRADACVG